ncbi:MAG: hypothetical protein ACLRWQ_03855 [Flavonifractor plautii]
MTGYQQYLARLWRPPPAINTVGIRDAGGNWYGENEALPEELEAAVEDYRCCSTTMYLTRKTGWRGSSR